MPVRFRCLLLASDGAGREMWRLLRIKLVAYRIAMTTHDTVNARAPAATAVLHDRHTCVMQTASLL